MTTCNKSGSIVDVECIYEDGKFILSSFDACVPDLFTVRFRAPADYTAGDVIVFRKEELPVRTPGMATATTDIFKAGAIVHADIDLASRRAFVWMGGAGGVLPNLSYEEQFAGYYDEEGRRVYMKTIDFGNIPTGTTQRPHGIPNVKRIINLIFCTYNPLNNPGHTSNYYVHANSYLTVMPSPALIECRAGGDWSMSGGNTLVARLHYTCTDR